MIRLILCLLIISVEANAQWKNVDGLKTLNGTSLYVSVHGSGKYLLVLHGGPGLNHSYFLPHLAALEKDFTVVYYDQRACGRSAIPSPDSITLKFLAGDIEAIRNALGVNKLNILAHSWGAVLATYYAAEYPGHIDNLIFSNPALLSRAFDDQAAMLMKQRTTAPDSTDRAKILASGNLDQKAYEDLFKISFRASAYDPRVMSKLNLNLPTNFKEASAALFTGLMKDPAVATDFYEVLPVLEKHDARVLIIAGVADIMPVPAMDRLQKQLPRSKTIVFQRSGHFPFVEETMRYVEVVSSFLKSP